MYLIQTILIVILGFALSRVWVRFRGGQVSLIASGFWTIIFAVALVGVVSPEYISLVANLVGIGRGVDLVLYLSVVILFYLVFRIYVMLEDLRHEITKLIRKIALENSKK